MKRVKSRIIQPNDAVQQRDIFGRVVALPSMSMVPDENGLFTIAQVAVLASIRGCRTHLIDDYGCEVRIDDYGCEVGTPLQYTTPFTAQTIVATDKGLWSPINIFRACREAAGRPHYEIDFAKVKIKNPDRLDEVRIAQVIGADGVRPYLKRPARYYVGEDTILRLENAVQGDWTYPMACIMGPPFSRAILGRFPDYRLAMRALDDAGLLKITAGSHDRFRRAQFEWLPLAYLPQPAQKLDPADAEALASLS
jgi:hypothetical protein